MTDPTLILSVDNRAALTAELLAWYADVKRDLPWRVPGNLYGIWISEIMLQQTTVQAVVPFWQRFMERFPTVQDLARAREADVLEMWSGLGYYSRARNLHAAAGIIQVIDEAACTQMVTAFETIKNAADNFPGLLIDFDHFSLDAD